MRVHLLTLPGTKSTVGEYIQIKFEIPHVSFKYTFGPDMPEDSVDHVIGICRKPHEAVADLIYLGYETSAAIEKYRIYSDYIYENAKTIINYESFKHLDILTKALFDHFALEDTNWKTKTGKDSLFNEIMGREISFEVWSEPYQDAFKESMYPEIVLKSIMDKRLSEYYNKVDSRTIKP